MVIVLGFELPGSREDLLSTSNSYTVSNIIGPKELPSKLQEARRSMIQDGAEYIFDYFDVYYSALHHSSQLDMSHIIGVYTDLIKGINTSLMHTITYTIQQGDDVNDETRDKVLSLTKMQLYMFAQIVNLIEQKEIASNNYDLVMKTSTARRKKQQQTSSSISSKNAYNRKDVLETINTLMQMKLDVLWQKTSVDEQFVTLVADVCYNMLPNVHLKQEKDTQKEMFCLIGILIKNYHHSASFVVHAIQLVRMYEHLPIIMAECVYFLYNQYQCKSLIHKLVNELTEWQTDERCQDDQGSRYCATLLTEISMRLPKLMIPEVMHLSKYLSHESAPLRTAVLNAIYEIILKVLHGTKLSEEEIESRDEFLEILLEHVNDVTANVRSKVIQHCAQLQRENVIPLHYQQKFLDEVAFHLRDKSALVRKSAINCMTQFLNYNVYGAVLKLNAVSKEIESIRTTVEVMKGGISCATAEEIQQLDGQWSEIKYELRQVVTEELRNISEHGYPENGGQRNTAETDNPHITQQEQQQHLDEQDAEERVDNGADKTNAEDEVSKQITDHLSKKKYQEAFHLVYKYCRHWDIWHQLTSKDDQSAEQQSEAQNEEELIGHILMFMRVLFCKLWNVINSLCSQIPNRKNLDKMEELETRLEYLERKQKFIQTLNGQVLTDCINLLDTITVSDMTESISFIIAAFKFGMEKSQNGVIAILKLMQRKEQERKDAAVNAFRDIFLKTDCNNIEQHAATIVARLIKFVQLITVSNSDYFQQVISDLTNKGTLDNSVINALWQYFSKKESPVIPAISDVDSRAATILLKFTAMGRATIITPNMPLVATIGFGERGQDDMQFLSAACQLVCVASRDPQFVRLPTDASIFSDLHAILMKHFTNVKCQFYNNALADGISVMYRLSTKPEVLVERLLASIAKDINADTEWYTIVLTRLCHLIGVLALNELIFLDGPVYKELKRRQAVRDRKKVITSSLPSSATISSRARNSARHSLAPNLMASDSIISSNNTDEVMEGAQAVDTDAEFIMNILENEIVTGQGYLSTLVPLLQSICAKPHIYSDQYLQGTAVIALIRCMLVSSKLCENNVQLLFTILEKSTKTELKVTVLMHMSDLISRFPNILEPWTERIFSRLHDSIDDVRRAALFTLSNLILRDMIRAHNHISHMALCIMDKNAELKDMSRIFFTQLSHKENNLYNVVPDIFSHLVKMLGEQKLSNEDFREIMAFLFGLVDKAKHVEGLVERFCGKFRLTENIVEHRNIAFCLSLMNYNDKALRKLQQRFDCFRPLLHDSDIYNHIKDILSNCIKQTGREAQAGAKNDLKAIAAEIENSIEEVFEIAPDQPANGETGPSNSQFKKPRIVRKKAVAKRNNAGPKKKGRATTRRKQRDNSSSGSESD